MRNGICMLAVSLVLAVLIAPAEPTFAVRSVRIGVLLDLSGRSGEIGRRIFRIAEAALDAANAEGGVTGKPVTLIPFDTGGDPVFGNHGARELVSFRNVVAVLGPADWTTAMMTKPFFEEASVPAMMLTSEDSVIRGGKYGTYDWVFQLPLTTDMALSRMSEYATKKGWRRLGLVTTADAFGREARQWLEKMGPRYGVGQVDVVSFLPGENVGPGLIDLVDRRPQAIVSWSPLPHAARVARVLKDLGVALPLFQCHKVLPHKYVSMVGPAAAQSFTVSNKTLVWSYLDDTDPQKEMIQDFANHHSDALGGGPDHALSPSSAYVWDSVMILVRALREAGMDRTGVRDSIEGIQRHIGLGGIYGFTREDHNGLDPDSIVVAQVDGIRPSDGQWVGTWRVAE